VYVKTVHIDTSEHWSSLRNEVNNTVSPDSKFSPTLAISLSFPLLLYKIPDIPRFLRFSFWGSLISDHPAHTHSVLTAIFPGEPELAGEPGLAGQVITLL